MKKDADQFYESLEYAYRRGFQAGVESRLSEEDLEEFDFDGSIYADILEGAIKKTRKEFKKEVRRIY